GIPRGSSTQTTHRERPVIVLNRLLGLVLGLALLAGGVIVTGEAALGLLRRGAWLIDRTALNRELAGLTWADPRVLPIAAGLVAAGLVLLLIELKPRRPAALPLRWSTEHCRAIVDRRGVEELLSATALADSDVSAARARVGRHRGRVKTRTVPGALDGRDRIHESLTRELDRLGLNLKLKVRAR
ncbi:MAG: DUF6286 domain-containing protein, partial [Egibacteraceae bacterium]